MPAISGISLLLSDVDGTLVTHEKVLTPRARQAVQRLKQNNIRFAITSGRPPRGMAMLIDPLALAEPVAGFNGGVYTSPDLVVLETHVLGADVAQEALAMLDRLGLDAWLYSGDTWFVRKSDAPHVAQEARTVGFGPKVVEHFDSPLDNVVKIVGVSDDAGKIAQAEEQVSGALSDQAAVSRSQPYYLDVTNPRANKAAVVRYHASRLGIPASAIATIGDMPNDVLMFRESGFSIAMGNATSDVQRQAKAVTSSCDDDGFAKAVERYFLDAAAS
ncbi:MAG TPA: Cof-type HAD-IIB family hydrolase [Rhizomicrobium sp.]|jgi:hypothetical protein